MPKGLKARTHQDRQKVIELLTPLIKQHVGSNLVALAVSGSFARGSDGAYSDIEFFGFVKRPPSDERTAVRFIHDGLLVDAWFMTRSTYISIFKDKVRMGEDSWPYVALNVLSPVFNAPFIQDLLTVPHVRAPDAFRQALVAFWPQVQEATAKLLTAVDRNDVAPTAYLYWQMVEKMCCALSYLNERPYSTRAAVFTEVLSFPSLPPSFSSLMLAPDEPGTPAKLADRARTVFHELEEMLQEQGCNLYAESLSSFVSPQSRGEELARKLKLDRVAHKARNLGRRLGVA